MTRLVERQLEQRKLELLTLTIASRPQLTKNALECYDEFIGLVTPWHAKPVKNVRNELSQAEAAWAAVFGDPDSPETQERIARTVEFLQRRGR